MMFRFPQPTCTCQCQQHADIKEILLLYFLGRRVVTAEGGKKKQKKVETLNKESKRHRPIQQWTKKTINYQ